MKNRWLVGLVLLTGCAKVIRTETDGIRSTVVRTTSCQHLGYCYGYSFAGKYEFAMSAFCPGTQEVTEVVQRYVTYYDDNTNSEEQRIVEILSQTSCI